MRNKQSNSRNTTGMVFHIWSSIVDRTHSKLRSDAETAYSIVSRMEAAEKKADPSDEAWNFHRRAEIFYGKFHDLLQFEVLQPTVADVWKVRIPSILLRDLRAATYFGRKRWFIYNQYALTNDTRILLQPTAPGFIEHQWENWKVPPPWLNLLALWTPAWLQLQLGSPLSALQLLVDVADHLRTRELLPLDEKSATMTALLTSAESLLKWPAHYLTLQRQENDHPLNEVRSLETQLWEKQKIQRDYLTRYATNFSPTQKLAADLHRELVHQLLNLKSSQEISPLPSQPTQGNAKPWKVPNCPPVTLPPAPETPNPSENPSQNRKRSAQDALIVDMREQSKFWRLELSWFHKEGK